MAWVPAAGGGGSFQAGQVTLPLFPPGGLTDLDFLESTVAAPGGSVVLLVPYSASRVYLAAYTQVGGGASQVATKRSIITSTVGRVFSATQPLIVTWSGDGAAVNQAWWVFTTTPVTIMVQQQFYTPKEW